MKVFLRWIYYAVMCIASFTTILFGALILVDGSIAPGVARIPVSIALIIVGFASAFKYMILGFDNENYYNITMKL